VVDAIGKHMEVIVDDTQLSLAIGKKGQNVRLAAKLLGWRIDIKSEEEKRQEVETAMAALSVPGAPVSVLIDYGLEESTAEKLLEAGVTTVEKLGAMTPEQLVELPGVAADDVDVIQAVVHSYYAQFEAAAQAEPAASAGPAVVAAAGEPLASLPPEAESEEPAPVQPEADPGAAEEQAAQTQEGESRQI